MSRHPSSLNTSLRQWLNSLFIDHAIFRIFWSNFHPVIEGKLYRSNHPTPQRLRRFVQNHHIKTLINLRGKRVCGSDFLSRKTAQKLGIQHLDMAFESRNAPQKDRILRFYDMYNHLQFPAIMHCKSGADRTGLAAALVILFEGGTIERARQELSWRYLHFSHTRTGILDAFFLMYKEQTSGKKDFLKWVKEDYNEEELKENKDRLLKNMS